MPANASSRQTSRLAWMIGIAALLTIAFCIALHWVTISRDPTPQAGAANVRSLRPYWIGSAALWLALTVVLRELPTKRCTHSKATPWSIRPAWVILSVAILARLIVVTTHDGSLSDDLWRYLFDGRALAAGHNPYLVAPAEIDPSAPRFEGEAELASRINNPELVTIYLPTSQWCFAAFTLATRSIASTIDSSARLLRLAFGAVDILVIVMLLLLLARRGSNPWWAIAYAWHPLAISEFAGSGHQDILGIALMFATLLLYDGARAATGRWSPVLAAAGAVKPVALPLAAVLLRHERAADWWRAILIGAVASTLLYASVGIWPGSAAMHRLLETVNRFVHDWAFHGAVYEPLLKLGVGLDAARLICLALLAAVAWLLWSLQIDRYQTARAVLFAALLCSPAAHPWYLLWSLALLPLSASPALWMASLTLPWGYVVLGDVVNWTVPVWGWGLTYLPIAAALLLDWTRRIHRARSRA